MSKILLLFACLFLSVCSTENYYAKQKCPDCKKCKPCPNPPPPLPTPTPDPTPGPNPPPPPPPPTPTPDPTPDPTPEPTPPPVPDECSTTVDNCPVKYGITWNCKKRFMFGANYAWHDFGTDFGGLKTWNNKGVLANSTLIDAELKDMKDNGVNVVRWWIFPDFRGDSVKFDDADTPIGINSSSSFFDDIKEALRLADKNDMYIMFVLFSYDAFKPTRIISDVKIRGLNPIAINDSKRKSLIENVIRPLAKSINANPYAKRVISWDLINEPEWAMTGKSKYGDPDFECNSGMECVTHEQIEKFLLEIIVVLKKETKSLVTLGNSAMKWKFAWKGLNLDYYQYHLYDWIQDWWPYSKTPTEYGVGDKPVIIGEWPVNGLAKVTNDVLIPGLLQYQYAGGLAWSVTDDKFDWPNNKSSLKKFAESHKCETTF